MNVIKQSASIDIFSFCRKMGGGNVDEGWDNVDEGWDKDKKGVDF